MISYAALPFLFISGFYLGHACAKYTRRKKETLVIGLVCLALAFLFM
jgi:hypothetical protein